MQGSKTYSTEFRLLAVEFVVARLLAVAYRDLDDAEFVEVAKAYSPAASGHLSQASVEGLAEAVEDLFQFAHYVRRRPTDG
jgi:hypothetical protein